MIPDIRPQMPWRVATVDVVGRYVLSVRFLDGLQGTVDMAGLILGARAGVFAALADVSVFRLAHVQHGAVVWPGELDLAPDAMHRAIKATGTWIL